MSKRDKKKIIERAMAKAGVSGRRKQLRAQHLYDTLSIIYLDDDDLIYQLAEKLA